MKGTIICIQMSEKNRLIINAIFFNWIEVLELVGLIFYAVKNYESL